jgi:hypothetical protein
MLVTVTLQKREYSLLEIIFHKKIKNKLFLPFVTAQNERRTLCSQAFASVRIFQNS